MKKPRFGHRFTFRSLMLSFGRGGKEAKNTFRQDSEHNENVENSDMETDQSNSLDLKLGVDDDIPWFGIHVREELQSSRDLTACSRNHMERNDEYLAFQAPDPRRRIVSFFDRKRKLHASPSTCSIGMGAFEIDDLQYFLGLMNESHEFTEPFGAGRQNNRIPRFGIVRSSRSLFQKY